MPQPPSPERPLSVEHGWCLRAMLGANASRAMQRLHPEHVVADFDALLHELSERERADALATA